MHNGHKSVLLIILLCLSFQPVSGSYTNRVTSVSDSSNDLTTSNSYITKIDPTILNQNSSLIDVVVHYDENVIIPDTIMGKDVDYRFNVLNAVAMELSIKDIFQLKQNNDVNYIEYNYQANSFLLDSTKHMGLPSSFWQFSDMTAGGMSIAIVDSGMDRYHAGFQDRVIASYNAINENATAATDTVGHGTHVAGIAAGYLPLESNEINETQRSTVPSSVCEGSSCSLSLAHQLESVDYSQPINIVLDWANEGEDNPASQVGYVIFDPNTGEIPCPEESCFVYSSSGFLNKTVLLQAGEYYIGVFNQQGGGDQVYESSITYSRNGFPTQEQAVKGVAYEANIVNVKVLDGLSGGNLSTFDTAIQFIIENRELYNISVVNLSLGLMFKSATLDALMAELVDNGILPVAAAGNSGLDSGGIYSPASAPEALTVGAINRIGEIAFYSNVGSSFTNGASSKPDVLAPGGSSASRAVGYETDYDLGFGLLMSLDANIPYNINKNDLTGFQGTSMASPHIAGLALLMAAEIQQTEGWDWNSREKVMKVKRAILSSTYEVANIGNGREQVPSELNPEFPSINRNTKDYQEGWGAVDTRAAYQLLSESISLGYSTSLLFDLEDPDVRKTYAYSMTLQAGTSYGFIADVPSLTDIDIKVVEASSSNAVDNGDLKILASTSGGIGEDEGIGLSVEDNKDVYVIISVVESDGEVLIPFEVTELQDLPSISIDSPFDNQDVTVPIIIEFSSSLNELDLYLDGEFQETIQSGHRIFDISLGQHNLDLRTVSQGITVSDSITINVIADTNNGILDFSIVPMLVISMVAIVLLRKSFSNKFNF